MITSTAIQRRQLQLLHSDSRYKHSYKFTRAVDGLECKIFEGVSIGDFLDLVAQINKIDKY